MSEGWIILGILVVGGLLWYFLMPNTVSSQRAKVVSNVVETQDTVEDPPIVIPQKLKTELFDICAIEIAGSCMEGFDGEITFELVITGEYENDIISGDNISMIVGRNNMMAYNPVINIRPAVRHENYPTFNMDYLIGGPTKISSIILTVKNAKALTSISVEFFNKTYEVDITYGNENGDDTVVIPIFNAEQPQEPTRYNDEFKDSKLYDYLYGVTGIVIKGDTGRGTFQVKDLEVFDIEGNLIKDVVSKTAANIDLENQTKIMEGLMPVKIDTSAHRNPEIYIAFALDKPTTCTAIEYTLERDAPIVVECEIETVDGKYQGFTVNPKGRINILDRGLKFTKKPNYAIEQSV